MKSFAAITLLFLTGFSLSGCQGEARSFAGFTFGGGGKTFSCEPAVWSDKAPGFELSAGTNGDSSTTLRLQGSGPLTLGEPAALTEASITVPTQEGPATLVSGHLVYQSTEGSVVHGSFDLKVKASDGREFPVVGSFTASKPPSR